MMTELPIQRATAAMIFNDMINANVRSGDAERTSVIESSGIIDKQVRWVAELRRLRIPIFWVRVERRADRKDRVDVLTDLFVAGGRIPTAPIVKGPLAQNIAELPIRPEDHEILKPRLSAFSGTDLDLQLRARHIDTILLGGISTNMGVESCARAGFDLDYHVVVLRDLCWAPDVQKHEWSLTRSLPAFARVMTSEAAGALLQ
jgi:nicotinamidase-related amidase